MQLMQLVEHSVQNDKLPIVPVQKCPTFLVQFTQPSAVMLLPTSHYYVGERKPSPQTELHEDWVKLE